VPLSSRPKLTQTVNRLDLRRAADITVFDEKVACNYSKALGLLKMESFSEEIKA
jgi:hypothetical protein